MPLQLSGVYPLYFCLHDCMHIKRMHVCCEWVSYFRKLDAPLACVSPLGSGFHRHPCYCLVPPQARDSFLPQHFNLKYLHSLGKHQSLTFKSNLTYFEFPLFKISYKVAVVLGWQFVPRVLLQVRKNDAWSLKQVSLIELAGVEWMRLSSSLQFVSHSHGAVNRTQSKLF